MKRSVYRSPKRFYKTPTGKPAYKIKRKKSSPARCGLCSNKLFGVPSAKKAKTKNRPQRVFGGTLCASCAEDVVKTKARLQAGVLKEADVSLTLLPYVKGFKLTQRA